MKTHKKLVSILCAAALLVSALPAASAVNAEPLSEYAGENVSVHVTQINADGKVTEAHINVDVPQNATVQEGQDLLQSAAIAAVDATARSTTEEDFENLYVGTELTLTTSYKSVRPLYMKHDYTRLVFMLNFGTFTDDPTNVTLRLTDENSNVYTINAALYSETDGRKSADIIIYEDRQYSGKYIPMHNGAYLDVYGKVNRGEIHFGGFLIKGYYNV